MATPPDAVGAGLSRLCTAYPGKVIFCPGIRCVSDMQATSTLCAARKAMRVERFCLTPSAFQLAMVSFSICLWDIKEEGLEQ